MSRLLYYLLIYPVSHLPLAVLHVLSNLFYFLVYRLAGYRKKVVRKNLENSFPEKTATEIKSIEKQFYGHFCDLIIESIRLFSVSKAEALERCRVVNPELLEHYAQQGKSVIIAAGHYNNWEWAAVTANPQVAPQVTGIYFPLANDFINDKLQQSRQRFGLELINKSDVKAAFQSNADRRMAYLFAIDQSPTVSKKVYWTQFLNQETAVFYGTEKYAREYDYPVLYGRIIKLERGRYEMEFEVVAEEPRALPEGEITERHTRLLEADIQAHPQYWLWTHKRWKRKREETTLVYEDKKL